MALTDANIDDSIAADWAAIQAGQPVDDEPLDEPLAPETPAEPVKDETPAKEISASEQAERDALGRFKKAVADSNRVVGEEEPAAKAEAKPEAKPAEAASAAPDASQEAQAQTQPNEQPVDLNRAPSSWKPSAREDWAKLPESVRAEVYRRETDFLNGQKQLLPDAQIGRSMREVVVPFRETVLRIADSPEKAIGSLLRTAKLFQSGTHQEKLAAVDSLFTHYGIDRAAYVAAITGQPAPQAQPGQQPTSQEFRDPRVDVLLQREHQAQIERQQAEHRAREQSVQAWLDEKDPAGKPLRPFVADVMTEMQPMMQAIQAQNPGMTAPQVLQAAYERAVRANPDTYAVLQRREMEEAEQRRRTENQARVREARRSNSVNVPRRASSPAPAKPGTMDETILETARELGLVS